MLLRGPRASTSTLHGKAHPQARLHRRHVGVGLQCLRSLNIEAGILSTASNDVVSVDIFSCTCV